jgi:uncharacterized protein YeaO (DUF488 family)
MAGDILELLFKIKSDASQAIKEAKSLSEGVSAETKKIKESAEKDFAAFRKEYETNLKKADDARAKTVFAAAYPHSRDAASFRKAWDDEFKKLNFGDFRKAYDDEMSRMEGGTKTAMLKIAQHFGIGAKGAAEFTQAAQTTAKGIAIVGAAAIGLGAALYALSKNATDLGSEIFDASVKLGFSAETLSTLKLSAESSGGSLESVSAALGIFNVNVSKAHQSGTQLNELFTKLGISTTDNEKALRRSFEILAQETNATDKARLAKQLFGRSYQDLFGIIDATNGNLDEAIEKYREMDSLITSDMARKADQLGDEFTEIGQKFRGMATDIGLELAPMIISALDDFADFIKDNKEGIIDGLTAIGKAIDIFLIKPLQGWVLLFGKLEQAGKAFKRFFDEQTATPAGLVSGTAGQAGDMVATAQGIRDASLAASVRSSTIQRSDLAGLLDDVATKDKKPKKTPGEELLADLQRSLESLGNKYDVLTGKTNVQRTALKLLESQYAGVSSEQRNDILTTARQIDVREKEISNLGLQKKAMDSLRGEIDKNRQAVQELLGTSKTHLDIVNELISASKRMNIEVSEETKTLSRFHAMLLDTAEGWERIRDAMKDIPSMLPDMGGVRAGAKGDFWGDMDIDADIGAPPVMDGVQQQIDMFDVLGQKISGVFGLGAEQAKTFGTITSEAFGQAAQGFASMIQTWATGGTLGDQAMKRLVSSVLGGVAAMAATQAIYEFAIGIAALTPWGMAIYGPAPIHFQAAALLAGIAASTAILGRAFAPSQSAQGAGGSAAGAGSAASSRNATGTGASSEPRIIEQDRNRREPQVIILRVESNDSHIIRTVASNIRSSGDIKVVMDSGGTLAHA